MTTCPTCYEFKMNSEIPFEEETKILAKHKCTFSKLRDTFAASALTGLLMNNRYDGFDSEDYAKSAYSLANMMLAERKQK